jgi:hypothetical protein
MSEKILDRVRKMLTLANDTGATEGERDTALRMAHNLLTKHQLTMGDVDAAAREREDPRGTFDMEGWGMPWCRSVRSAIANLFMCTYYTQKINATRYKHFFVGRESNATTAMYMADFIVRGLLKEADQRYGHRLTPLGRSFGEGAALRLWTRVHELRAVKQQEIKSEGYALVLMDLAKQEKDENEKLLPALREGRKREIKGDSGAMRAGYDHAGKISLDVQVSTTAAPKQIE